MSRGQGDAMYERVARRVDVEVIRLLIAQQDRFMLAALEQLPVELVRLVHQQLGTPCEEDAERVQLRPSASWTQRARNHALERLRGEYLRQVAREQEQ